MTEEQRRQLQQQLWNIANTLRGKMNTDEFYLSQTPIRENWTIY
jgi:type I restriction-modification system DNA methylase subunit